MISFDLLQLGSNTTSKLSSNWSDISNVVISTTVPNEFSFNIGKTKHTFWCDERLELLTDLYKCYKSKSYQEFSCEKFTKYSEVNNYIEYV